MEIKDLGVSIIDLMVKHNKEAENEEDKIKIGEMIYNAMTFHLAGMDTSRTTSESLINFVSLNPKQKNFLTEKIFPEIFEKDKYIYETYDSSAQLNQFIEEILRFYNPAELTFPREVTRDLKLGKYLLKKGSKVMIPIHALHTSGRFFENEEKFDLERFSEENSKKIKKNTFLPFSGGRRACIGKYFGLLMIKTNVCSFFENFEILKGYESNHVIRFTYGVENCFLDLKLKGK